MIQFGEASRVAGSCRLTMAAWTLGILNSKGDGGCNGREGMRLGDFVCAGHEDDGGSGNPRKHQPTDSFF